MKRTMALVLLAAFWCVLLFTGLTVKPSVVSACSCAFSPSAEETLERSAAVFRGTVVSIVDRNEGALARSSGDPLEVTFQVDAVWKGKVLPEIMVTTPMSSASCGFTFVEGVSYLVYANEGGDGGLKAYLCSRTTQTSNAKADLAVLGSGDVPEALPGTDDGHARDGGAEGTEVPNEQGTTAATGGVDGRGNGDERGHENGDERRHENGDENGSQTAAGPDEALAPGEGDMSSWSESFLSGGKWIFMLVLAVFILLGFLALRHRAAKRK